MTAETRTTATLGRQADPDGTFADRDVLRMRSDGHDSGDTRLKFDGFSSRLPCGPIDGPFPKPQPEARQAGGRQRECQGDRRDPGAAALFPWRLVGLRSDT